MKKTMTGYLKIQNAGEMDVNAITLLGASSKRDDATKIGFFGSGLKYALAVLLRHGVPVQMFAGTKEIDISTIERNFREKSFQVITINGNETSLTTDMGVDWELWFAVREFHCNALDEGGHTLGITDQPKGEKGKTNIYIGFTPEIRQIEQNWNRYFAEKRTDIEVKAETFNGENKAYTASDNLLVVYRKGIRVHAEETRALYHYDLSDLKINESRVVADSFDMRIKISTFLKQSATESMASRILEEDKVWEKEQLMYDWGTAFNENWFRAVDGRTIIPQEFTGYFIEEMTGHELILPLEMVHALRKSFRERIKIKGLAMSANDSVIRMETKPEERKTIEEVVATLAKVGLDINYPINVVQFTDDRQLGQAKDGEILLARKLFLLGYREIMSTILEEYAHVSSGAGDKTRSFPNISHQYVH
jgi:hypothetical protein